MDVWFPGASVLDLVLGGDGVAEADLGRAVEAQVALFVVLGEAVGVRWVWGRGIAWRGRDRFGVQGGGCGEGAAEGEEEGG